MEGTDPVNKKLAAALSSGAALVLALTGCSDDSGKTDDWAKQVCDDLQPQLNKIDQANASIAEASQASKPPEEVKKADAAGFQKVSDAYKAMARAVKKAGAPPVDDGEKLQKDAVKELNRISGEYQELKVAAEKLPTGDKFDEGLDKLAAKLKSLGQSGDKALQRLQKGEVGKAMAKQESCKKTGVTKDGS
ncbi:small secreted protein [Streptomyces smyrnaeus]|uniref:small secreted protein n=1 Tax=Streptomyces TaxID=1883 RepID=UPI001B358683|nr:MULTISPECIES: small secreted protein [unclassified Streptomyces]MBQ0868154.1 small secreted protein [Streptomyces sp. RK75]MBQ1121295.1 small secreted protein [Streptomyces sp. B15]MBQ1156749.1 small secreted protein [Streptomyces sp. A73]